MGAITADEVWECFRGFLEVLRVCSSSNDFCDRNSILNGLQWARLAEDASCSGLPPAKVPKVSLHDQKIHSYLCVSHLVIPSRMVLLDGPHKSPHPTTLPAGNDSRMPEAHGRRSQGNASRKEASAEQAAQPLQPRSSVLCGNFGSLWVTDRRWRCIPCTRCQPQ